MKPNHEPNTLETSGESVAAFGISTKDEAHVLGILRDQIYSDKVLAVVREYSTNAWDANRSAGKHETPISVHLPTYEEPYFSVEDFGPGLSPSDVADVFTKYGASTKRGCDDQVGMLGIGSKSAFSYAASFTVISLHGGQKRTYVCALDESDLGSVTLLGDETCGPDTGVEVRVAVRQGDVEEFREKALKLFEHFHPAPNCGSDTASIPCTPEDRIVVSNDSGATIAWVDGQDRECIAVMGCVPYSVDLDQIELPEDLSWAAGASITLHFPIGAVQFAASREELRYTQKTKDAIVAALGEVTDKLVSRVLVEIESVGTSAFARRLKLQQLNRFDLPLPAEYEDLAKEYVQLVDKYDGTIPFTLTHDGNSVGRVTINRALRFLLQDQTNKLSGYSLSDHDYVVAGRGKTKAALAAARVGLEAHLKASGLEGVPIAMLSTIPWSRPWNARKSSAKLPGSAARYKATMLLLEADRGRWSGALSGRWEPVTRTPDGSDVYVELEKFKGLGHSDFYGSYRLVSDVLKLFGESPPALYGYKVGKGPQPRLGVTFNEWWTTKLAELLARADVKAGLLAHESKECLPHLGSRAITELRAGLGDSHPLVAPYVAAAGEIPSWARTLYDMSSFRLKSAPARKWLDHALKRYPLIDNMDKFEWSLAGARSAWIEYVLLIDERDARAAAAQTQIPAGLLSAVA